MFEKTLGENLTLRFGLDFFTFCRRCVGKTLGGSLFCSFTEDNEKIKFVLVNTPSSLNNKKLHK